MSPATGRLKFGDFSLDQEKRILLRGDREVHLTPKSFETFRRLVQERDRVVTKEEFLRELWPDVFVTENVLTQCISEIRAALGDDVQHPRYIRTIPRVGYRFIAEVSEASPPAREMYAEEFSGLSIELESGVESEDPAARVRGMGWKPLAAAGVGLALLLGLLTVDLSLKETPANIQGSLEQGIHTLAVLPFRSLTGDSSSEALGLGLTDALILRMTELSKIAVRPTSAVLRFADGSVDPVGAGQELGATAVLDGKFQIQGQDIRVSAQLIRVSDGITLWAGQFDEPNAHIFQVQDAIAQRIADTLSLQLDGREKERLSRRYTDNWEAYEQYAKGRYYVGRRTEDAQHKAVAYFNSAIDLDPTYALAYAGLADAYIVMGNYGYLPPGEAMPIAEAAVRKALEIDPGLGTAHVSLAVLNMDYFREWERAADEFRIALRLNPNNADVHLGYGQLLVWLKRFEEARAEIERAQHLDPLSPRPRAVMGWALFMAREYEKAAVQLQKTLQMDPDFLLTHLNLGMVYAEMGRYQEAIEALQRARELSNDNPDVLGLLGYVYGVAGRPTPAREILQRLQRLGDRGYLAPIAPALVHIGLGDRERAIDFLFEAYEQHAWHLGMLEVHPQFDTLRSEPRFQELLEKLGLKSYSK